MFNPGLLLGKDFSSLLYMYPCMDIQISQRRKTTARINVSGIRTCISVDLLNFPCHNAPAILSALFFLPFWPLFSSAWDSEEIDHWKIEEFKQGDMPHPLLEESSFATLFPRCDWGVVRVCGSGEGVRV